MNEETLISKMKELISSVYPQIDTDVYQAGVIEELAKHFIKVGENPTKFILSYKENVQLSVLENVKIHIKEDLIKVKRLSTYANHDKEAANDLELGILKTISLIEFRIHCICDF